MFRNDLVYNRRLDKMPQDARVYSYFSLRKNEFNGITPVQRIPSSGILRLYTSGIHITVEIFMDESRESGFSGENIVKHSRVPSTDIENQCLRSLENCGPTLVHTRGCYTYPETESRQ